MGVDLTIWETHTQNRKRAEATLGMVNPITFINTALAESLSQNEKKRLIPFSFTLRNNVFGKNHGAVVRKETDPGSRGRNRPTHSERQGQGGLCPVQVPSDALDGLKQLLRRLRKSERSRRSQSRPRPPQPEGVQRVRLEAVPLSATDSTRLHPR
jgi:hypothetical protein